MKIAFDHQTFSLQNFGGISRYFVELMSAFEKRSDIQFTLPILFSNNHYLKSLTSVSARTFFEHRKLRGKQKLVYQMNQPGSIWSLRTADYDLFHPTYYEPYFLPHLRGRPYVLTVYDMIHELFPGEYSPRADYSARKKKLITSASRIIAISESTKRDILKFNPEIDPEIVKVVHLGDSLSRISGEAPSRNDLPGKYVLFVGNRGSYKNFLPMVQALGDLMLADRDLHIVCVGGSAFTEDEVACFEHLGILARVKRFNASDEELAAFYRQAAAFVFPSQYEGFGIPVLEAFATNCPMALSNAGSLPEVAGDAAVYFDPSDPIAIQAAVKSILIDSSLREKLTEKGRERLKMFSWEETAARTLDVYRGALADR